MSSVLENGAVNRIVDVKPKRKAKAKREVRSVHSNAVANKRSYYWCSAYVSMALALSAFLNGYANAHAVENKAAGWILGLTIPLLVFTLFKAAGWLHTQRNKPLAIAAAIFGTVLLFLSVADCQTALGMLTSTTNLSWAFAITIDCGLVVCELGAMQVFQRR